MSILLRVNSKYKNIGESNANFTYDLLSSQAAASVTSITALSFTMNRLFTNIASYNNTLIFQDGSLVQYVQTITPAQYTANELLVQLNTFTIPGYTITWTLVNDKYQVVITGATPLLLLVSSTLATYIGLSATLTLVPAVPQILQSYPQLQHPDEIYVQSSIMATGSCLDTDQVGGSIPLLLAVGCANVPYGFSINYQTAQQEQYTSYSNKGVPMQLRSIGIQICDKYGNLLNIPENCFVDIIFRITFLE